MAVMKAINVCKVIPGDTIQGHEDYFRVVDYPEEVIWGGKKDLRVPVADAFGRTRVLVREDMVRGFRKPVL